MAESHCLLYSLSIIQHPNWDNYEHEPEVVLRQLQSCCARHVYKFTVLRPTTLSDA